MSTSLRLLAAFAAALVAGSLLAAPAATASTAVAASTAKTNYQVPKVGECHLLTRKQANAPADRSAAVPCTGKHTTMTTAVKLLSGDVNWRNVAALSTKADRKCFNGVERVLGGTDNLRSMTAYTSFWFIPTKAKRKRGAKWIRCDVGLVGGTRLMPITADVTLHSDQLPDSLRRCLTARGLMTVCTRSHAYRSVGAFRISGGYPSEKRALSLALRKCDRFVTTKRFWYVYPSRGKWAAGSRAMVCFNKTRR